MGTVIAVWDTIKIENTLDEMAHKMKSGGGIESW
jgi:hypothetical protein